MTTSQWPELPSGAWTDTLETLHLWTQIVGKIRMECSPWMNHSWSVPLYVGARGLGTGPFPYGNRLMEIDFDFIAHRLALKDSAGGERAIPLRPMSVADFHAAVTEALDALDAEVDICRKPNELPDPIPFHEDTVHAAYEAEHARRLWAALVQAHRVLTEFRSRFVGKVSPVHFFWGSFDLAVTRFSGDAAPEHPGGIPHLPDEITREAYSHAVSSAGFWPGNRDAPMPIFYSYAYPTPDGFAEAAVQPDAAFWLDSFGEFALPYEAVRTSADPDATLLAFLESTYAAAADRLGWERKALERPPGWRPLGANPRPGSTMGTGTP